MTIALSIILAYLLGSIPFGFLIVKILTGKDLRKEGSGSTGATNVSRILGMKFFFIVSIFDIGKGTLAVYLGSLITGNGLHSLIPIICGIVAILGHIFPVWLKFKGGKGVNTSLGVALIVSPYGAAMALLAFGIMLAITKYISAGSLTAGICYPIGIFLANILFNIHTPDIVYYFGFLVPVALTITHIKNIKRLIKGEENPFGKQKKNKI